MPELAEVAFACSIWNSNLNQKIKKVEVSKTSRVFRDCEPSQVEDALSQTILKSSATHGKQMLFKFTGDKWLGLHLGMTGSLALEESSYTAEKHDALILYQPSATLIFKDPRQFGKVSLHNGKTVPSWWKDLPTSMLDEKFDQQIVTTALKRHARRPIKALLLDQRYFQGMGNWMADEVLWRAAIHPASPCGKIKKTAEDHLFKQILFVARGAMNSVGVNGGDPPKGWLFHARWKDGGLCPKTGKKLRREKIGGRTSCWCPHIQNK